MFLWDKKVEIIHAAVEGELSKFAGDISGLQKQVTVMVVQMELNMEDEYINHDDQQSFQNLADPEDAAS
jgi:hypothetical protein